MLLLFSLGQHAALNAVASRLEEGERLFAFLDDLCVLCDPELRRQAGSPAQDEGLEQGWFCASRSGTRSA